MSKGKIGFVILLLLLIGSALYAFSLFSQMEVLQKEKANLANNLTKAEENANRLAAERKQIEGQLKDALDKSDRLTKQLSDIRTQADAISAERDDWRNKFESIRKERDDLIVKLQQKPEPQIIYKEVPAAQAFVAAPVPSVIEIPPMPEIPEGEAQDRYWASVLREKASLALKVSELESQISSSAISVEELKKKNSDLELEIGALNQKKEDIERKIKYSEDLVTTLSIDLAREKNDKRYVADRFESIKSENESLRGQVKELTSAKIALEKSIVRLTEDKKGVDKKLAETESVIQNRISEILDIKRSVDEKLNPATTLSSKEVELPPIIVSAPAPGSQTKATAENVSSGFNGKVLSINPDNNFVIVDLGENDGIRVGDRLGVFRGAKYLTAVEVIQTRKDISAADIKQKGVKIQVGDIVK